MRLMLKTLTDALAAHSLSEFHVKRGRYGYLVSVYVPYTWLADWRVEMVAPNLPEPKLSYWAHELETAFVGAAALLGSVAEDVAQRVDAQAG